MSEDQGHALRRMKHKHKYVYQLYEYEYFLFLSSNLNSLKVFILGLRSKHLSPPNRSIQISFNLALTKKKTLPGNQSIQIGFSPIPSDQFNSVHNATLIYPRKKRARRYLFLNIQPGPNPPPL